MHHPSRPPNRCDGSTAVTATQGRGEVPPPSCAAGAPAQISRSDNGGERRSSGFGEPDSPSWRGIIPVDSLGVFQTIFHLPRSLSIGYFSADGDSLPTSPLSPRPPTADRATQTPSLSGQAMQHALQRMAGLCGGEPGTHQQHGNTASPSSTQPRNVARDMQTEAIGRELRRFGDDYNRLLLLRRVEGRNRQVVIYPIPVPPINQEPAMLICVGLLLLMIGGFIYLQGSTDSLDNSQV